MRVHLTGYCVVVRGRGRTGMEYWRLGEGDALIKSGGFKLVLSITGFCSFGSGLCFFAKCIFDLGFAACGQSRSFLSCSCRGLASACLRSFYHNGFRTFFVVGVLLRLVFSSLLVGFWFAFRLRPLLLGSSAPGCIQTLG